MIGLHSSKRSTNYHILYHQSENAAIPKHSLLPLHSAYTSGNNKGAFWGYVRIEEATCWKLLNCFKRGF